MKQIKNIPASRSSYLACSLFTAFFLLLGNGILSAQIWDWGRQPDEQENSFGSHVYSATDPLGFVVVVGDLDNPATFGGNQLPADRGFMAKYRPDGSLVWAKSLSASLCTVGGGIFPSGIRIDNSGQIYVVYNCLNGLANANFSVTKFDPQGNEILTTASTGTGDGNANDLAISPSGEIFIAGQMYRNANGADSLILGDLFLQGNNINRPFLFKLSPDGTPEWVLAGQHVGSTGGLADVTGARVTLDEDGNAYLMGVSRRFVNFGNGLILEVSSFSNGEVYVVKVNSQGVPQWLESTIDGPGVTLRPEARDIQYDSQRETLVLYGKFEGYFLWNGGQRTPETGTLFYGDFVLGLDTDGAFKFLNHVSLEESVPNTGYGGMAIDEQTGDIYTTGSAGRSRLDTLVVNDICDGIRAHVATFNQNGDGKWITGITCREDEGRDVKAIDLSTDSQGNIYISGDLESAIFALDTLETPIFGTVSPFVAKLLNKEIILSGKLFRDYNGNGERDNDEEGIPGFVFESTPLALTSVSDQEGNYSFPVNINEHNVRLPVLPQHHIMISPADSNYTISTNAAGEVFADNDFAVQPLPGIHDLEVELTPISRVRPGFIAQYQLRCTNVGSTTQDASVHMIHSDTLSFLNASTPVTSYDTIATTLNWELGAFEPYQDTTITISFSVPILAPLDGTVTHTVEILPIIGDIEPDDNVQELQQIINGSFDPNDKQALSGTLITPPEVAEGAVIDYLIRFQNTGTDTAFTVIVEDSIPNLLDHSTFTMVDASHSYSLSINDNGVYSWRFDNILLPDSTTNEPASHGFIRFRIEAERDLVPGDVIYNQAAIFFDYNAPIITNTSEVTVASPNTISAPRAEDLSFSVFPNPSRGPVLIAIALPNPGPGDISLFNAQGQLVFTDKVQLSRGLNQLEYDWQALPSGTYFLQVQQGVKQSVRTWIKP